MIVKSFTLIWLKLNHFLFYFTHMYVAGFAGLCIFHILQYMGWKNTACNDEQNLMLLWNFPLLQLFSLLHSISHSLFQNIYFILHTWRILHSLSLHIKQETKDEVTLKMIYWMLSSISFSLKFYERWTLCMLTKDRKVLVAVHLIVDIYAFVALPLDDKLSALLRKFYFLFFFLICDNFHSVPYQDYCWVRKVLNFYVKNFSW